MGEKSQTHPATPGAKEVSFDVELAAGSSHLVKADLLDDPGKVIAGGYYVYCRRKHPDHHLHDQIIDTSLRTQ